MDKKASYEFGLVDELEKIAHGERFKKLEHKIAAKGEVSDPAAVTAAIGRKKYGKTKFEHMAEAGKK